MVLDQQSDGSRFKALSMHTSKAIVGIIAAAGIGAGGLFAASMVELPIAEGELSTALLSSSQDEAALTAVFARFLASEPRLEDRQAVLERNGFRCRIKSAQVEGSRYLTCLRPMEGTGYCKGINYYSYETAEGEIIETLGSSFDATGKKNFLGQCTTARQEYRGDVD